MSEAATGRILYLSRADVEATGLGLEMVEHAVAQVFTDKAAGRIHYHPKTTIKPDHGRSYFLCMPGDVPTPPVAGVKWVGLAPPSPSGGPHITGLIVLSDAESCVPQAVMDATWITGVRTAAVTAVAARVLARADSAVVGFVACGLQARTHLAALARHFPLEKVLAYSRRTETAEAFAAEARAQGFAAEVATRPEDAVTDVDIVVSSVPPSPNLKPFLDPDWLKPGAFASLVDLGRSWQPAGMAALDGLVTDDMPQAEGLAAHGHVIHKGPFTVDLGQILTGARPGRANAGQRLALLAPGMVLSDLAVAAAVLERARERGLGTPLPF